MSASSLVSDIPVPTSYETKKILLVEDEAILALVTRQTLEKNGYIVVHVATGEAAVTTVAEEPAVDLILMDIDLGKGIDGIAAAEQILQDHNLPVLFLSSHTEPEVVERTERTTSYGYVVKSSAPTVLFASMKMAFKLFTAHAQLQQERNTLLETMSAVPVGMLVVDGDYTVIQANPAAEMFYHGPAGKDGLARCGDYLGCANRHLTPMGCGESPVCSACEVFARIKATFRTGEGSAPQTTEFQVGGGARGESSRTAWFRHSTTPVTIGGNAAVLLTIEDITVERLVRERLRLLGAIAESENVMVVITDKERRTTWVNETGLRLTGYSLGEMVGRNPGELLQGPEPDPVLKEEMSRAFDAGKAFRGEIYNYRKDGRGYWIHMDIQPVRDDSGKLTHFVAVQEDVTERRELELRLRAQDRRTREVVARTAEGIVIMNAAGTVVSANPAYAATTGYPVSEIVGLTMEQVFERIHPEDALYLQKAIYPALENGAERMIYRYRLRTPAGGYIWLEDSTICFYDLTGAIEQSYVFSRQVTDPQPTEPAFHIVAAAALS